MNHESAIAAFTRFDAQLVSMAMQALTMADSRRYVGDRAAAEECMEDVRACLEARHLPRLRKVNPVTAPLSKLAKEKRSVRYELYGGFTRAERSA